MADDPGSAGAIIFGSIARLPTMRILNRQQACKEALLIPDFVESGQYRPL
jgi:hypothetical protein